MARNPLFSGKTSSLAASFVVAGLLMTAGCGEATPEVEATPETTPWLFPEPQMELLEASDPRVRGLAIKNLEKMGANAKPAIPALEELLNDEDEKIRALAERALKTIRADLGE